MTSTLLPIGIFGAGAADLAGSMGAGLVTATDPVLFDEGTAAAAMEIGEVWFHSGRVSLFAPKEDSMEAAWRSLISGRFIPTAGRPKFSPQSVEAGGGGGAAAPRAPRRGPVYEAIKSLLEGGHSRKPALLSPLHPPWHEDESFWRSVEPVLFSRQRIENARREAVSVMKLLNLTRNQEVLDLGCGIGRHAVELARHGLQVTGLDRTEAYLVQARRIGRERGVRVEWIRDDMRRFRRTNAFDAILSLYTTFGYFGERENLQVARNAHRSLKPGGRFLIEVLGREGALGDRRQKATYQIGKTVVREERRVREGPSRLELQWEITRGADKRRVSLSHHLYSAVELSRLLKRAGFHSIETYGDLRGRPYGKKARQLIVVAQK